MFGSTFSIKQCCKVYNVKMKLCFSIFLICFATTFAGEIPFYLLKINLYIYCFLYLEKPKLVDLPKKIEQLMDKSYALTCILSFGEQPIHFEWFKNNQPLRKNERFSIDHHEMLSSVSLRKLQQNDSGIYSCVAKNQFGTDSISTQLLVLGLFQIV